MVIYKTNHYINLESQYGANNYQPLDVVITKGQGVWVEDVDGDYWDHIIKVFTN
ncbi:MAG: hypothetical protein KAV87_08795 [Desulfobacteraceae bacterium]|jgi:ornithine--oxo-acid transaminase|nr:hypothetical protein [Desulfobacteraceae bacterium]